MAVHTKCFSKANIGLSLLRDALFLIGPLQDTISFIAERKNI